MATDFTVSDLEYNLITTLSNLLQSEEVLARYTKDAEEVGDKEAAACFEQLREQNKKVALRMRESLYRLISQN